MKQSFLPTRAQNLGIKPKVLAARTKKSLATHREALLKLGAPWTDIDNSVTAPLMNLLEAFDEFSQYVDNTVEWLNEVAE